MRDAALARQLRTALASVALNIAEANGRTGGDRLHHFRIALGSLRESGAVLDVAVALGWLAAAPLDAERAGSPGCCSSSSAGDAEPDPDSDSDSDSDPDPDPRAHDRRTRVVRSRR